jgi:hypothetical protein
LKHAADVQSKAQKLQKDLGEAVVKFENTMAAQCKEHEEERRNLEAQRSQLNEARREFEVDVAREAANRRAVARQEAHRSRHQLPFPLSRHTTAHQYNEDDDSSEDDDNW